MRHLDIFDTIGNTPTISLTDVRADDCSFFLKLEGYSPSGSLKDRSCAYMLRDAIARRKLYQGKTLLDASSGNFACAMTLLGAKLGYGSAVAVSSKLTSAKRDFLRYFGATVFEVGNFTIDGNQFCKELAQKEPEKYCFLDQLHNWQNPQAHYETTGPEILSDFPDVSMVVGSLGSGGTMAGVGRYLKEKAPHVAIVAVNCQSGSRIAGVGSFADGDYLTPFIDDAHNNCYFDHTVSITEADASVSTLAVNRQGTFCGLQTGAVVHAALSSAKALKIRGSVVIISGDMGWKGLDKLLGASKSP